MNPSCPGAGTARSSSTVCLIVNAFVMVVMPFFEIRKIFCSKKYFLSTLYFENTGIPFRCITQYQSARKLKNKSAKKTPFTFLLSFFRKSKPFTFTDFCNEENDFFKTHSNNLRVKMKYLAQHGTFGWKFHDRFLIFVPHDITDIPTVYSLGISVSPV